MNDNMKKEYVYKLNFFLEERMIIKLDLSLKNRFMDFKKGL